MNYKRARKFLENKRKKTRIILDKRYNKACKDFHKIKQVIITNYNPIRIYQWGSLLNRKNFSEISDIDIAVEGIVSADEFFKLFGEVMELTDFSVDLVQMEKIDPEYAELIREKGQIVYER